MTYLPWVHHFVMSKGHSQLSQVREACANMWMVQQRFSFNKVIIKNIVHTNQMEVIFYFFGDNSNIFKASLAKIQQGR